MNRDLIFFLGGYVFAGLLVEFLLILNGTQGMNPNDSEDPQTFPVVPPADPCFHLSCETSTRWIGTKSCTDIHDSLTTCPVADLSTFPPAPP